MISRLKSIIQNLKLTVFIFQFDNEYGGGGETGSIYEILEKLVTFMFRDCKWYMHGTLVEMTRNDLNVLHVHGPCFIAPNMEHKVIIVAL